MEAGPAALFDYLYSLGMTVVNTKTHLNPSYDYDCDRIILLSPIHGQTNYSMELTDLMADKNLLTDKKCYSYGYLLSSTSLKIIL